MAHDPHPNPDPGAALADEVAAQDDVMERLLYVYKSHMAQLCRQANLTMPQLYALDTIARLHRSKMSPLAERLGLSMGASSTLVDRLATRGLVQRDADAADRRAVYVSLSEKGQRLLEEARQARTELLHRVFAQLEPGVRATLATSLSALLEAWNTLPSPGTPPGLACLDE
ncbi:MAG: MarR family transcriptional regulator [Candidatus Sericytochromatia bacterium]|nr:MarR family transcriptional regulator [Candidatus Sericytochromatia bacterium]